MKYLKDGDISTSRIFIFCNETIVPVPVRCFRYSFNTRTVSAHCTPAPARALRMERRVSLYTHQGVCNMTEADTRYGKNRNEETLMGSCYFKK